MNHTLPCFLSLFAVFQVASFRPPNSAADDSAVSASVYESELNTGDETPNGWQLTGGDGRWKNREFVEVTGTGSDSNYWHTSDCPFAPNTLYHFEMRARRLSGSGLTICGPQFANRDHSAIAKDWTWYGYVFRTPQNTQGAFLRLGQWNAPGTVQFDAIRIRRTLPVYRAVGDIVLGEGESLRDGYYRFRGGFSHPGSNDHRTLVKSTTGFNSDRWCFGAGNEVVYRFAIPHHTFQSGSLRFNVNYHVRGRCVAEMSLDDRDWRLVATQDAVGTQEVTLPKKLFPAKELFLRLHAPDASSSFQVNRIDLDAAMSCENQTDVAMEGHTDYADILTESPRLSIQSITLRQQAQNGAAQLNLVALNRHGETETAVLHASMTSPRGSGRELIDSTASLPGNGRASFQIDLTANEPGTHRVDLELKGRGGAAAKTAVSIFVPEYYRSDYGELIASGTEDPSIWWCDATRKIPRQRAVPTKTGAGVSLSAAKNDFEAVQVVVRPQRPLHKLMATATVKGRIDASGAIQTPATASMPTVDVLQVYYHFVDHPTDRTGVRDFWPDALPPLSTPIDVPADRNQPLWVLVHVPKDAPAGDYTGELSLTAEGWSATVPFQLHVWDFTLPETNHIETAFGFSPGNVFRYQGLKNEADRRRVIDAYFRCFADHRISPYDPTPFDPIRVTFQAKAVPPTATLDFTQFDAAMTRAVDKFHFTGFRLPISGMGGGTFHNRYAPQIDGFGEDTAEYKAMFGSYVGQVERHLRQKGWLNKAYVYWFDEPAPKDYDFVTQGMQRLKKYAPGLRRMLTEEPNQQLKAPIDIWCPVTSNYDHEQAEKRRKLGEKLWWYVCTGPKAPFCTLFIDHPATELRAWLWQSWKYDVGGILVWQSNYWTSSAAFPKTAQNPYEDPMGYVSGYSTPAGTKRFWGNGDGRFIYPPLSAATPPASGAQPNMEPPASSIRWEMLREGIEDYEYLHLLSELLAEHGPHLGVEKRQQLAALLTVPDSITTSMTHFTTDSTPLYARRAMIARAIETLSTARQ